VNRRTVLQFLSTAGITQFGAAFGSLGNAPGKELLLRPQRFGAKADGITLDTQAINSAIDRAHAEGGGMVYLSPGFYLCGTVVLKSNVTLYLEAGAVIVGSKDIKQYTPQPGPSKDADANNRHLIFAKDSENVTLCGPGTVDGQGPSFWVPSGRRYYPPEEQWADVASLYLNPRPRVSPMLEFVNCRHLTVETIRLENASGWTMRLMSCVGVVVDNVSIKNPVVGPNTDGIDVSNSSDVRIANCSIDTGDDAICLKSENPYGDTVPVMRNVVVTNCTLTSCCNGFKFGTRTYSGCENIVFSNSTIHNTADSDLNARVISGICLEMVDGGWLEGVMITGICMQRTRTPIFLRLGARTPPRSDGHTYLRGVMISDVYATEAVLTNSITGLPGMPVEDVTLSNIHLETQETNRTEWTRREVQEAPRDYPESRMFGPLPAYGMYVRHARGVRMHDVVFKSSATEQRPAVVCEDVTSLEIAGMRVPLSGNGAPVIDLRQTKDVWIRDGRVPQDASSLVSVAGGHSADILISGCDLLKTKQPVILASDAATTSVTLANNILREKVL
jgi:polygalacturonase